MTVRAAILTAALIAAPLTLAAQTPAPPASATTATTATAASAPAPAVHPRVGNETELGRKYTEWFYTAQFDSLWTHMSDDTKKGLGQVSELGKMLDQVFVHAGEETKVIEERVVMRNGNPQYWRTASFSMMAEPLMIRWVIVNGEIWGVGMNPASQAPPIDPVQ